MSRHDYDYHDYYSDEGTRISSRSRGTRRPPPRNRPYSEDSYSPRPRYERQNSSTYSRFSRGANGQAAGDDNKFAKVAIGAVFVAVVANAWHSWVKKKGEEREKERLREKQRRFEKAKARRRREEDRSETKRQDRMRREQEAYEESELSGVRRIEYQPAGKTESRSRSRQPRKLEAPPEQYDDEDDLDDTRRKNRSRSRPAVDAT